MLEGLQRAADLLASGVGRMRLSSQSTVALSVCAGASYVRGAPGVVR